MHQLLYVTTNTDKFNKAQLNLKKFQIKLSQKAFEFEEKQTFDSQEIVKDKAHQAFVHFQQPVLVNDDIWEIPSLNGFPGANMKLCNHYLVGEDWLRLMHGKTDRQLFMTSNYALHTGKEIFTVAHRYEYYFLEEIRGQHSVAPHLTVIARKGQTDSVAETISQGDLAETKLSLWPSLADQILAL